MHMHNLPNLSTLPPIVLLGDPDGLIERAAWSLLLVDIVASARLALQIENRYRRAVWLRGFRPATLQAAHCQSKMIAPAQTGKENQHGT
jgi:hypothetical protein